MAPLRSQCVGSAAAPQSRYTRTIFYAVSPFFTQIPSLPPDPALRCRPGSPRRIRMSAAGEVFSVFASTSHRLPNVLVPGIAPRAGSDRRFLMARLRRHRCDVKDAPTQHKSVIRPCWVGANGDENWSRFARHASLGLLPRDRRRLWRRVLPPTAGMAAYGGNTSRLRRPHRPPTAANLPPPGGPASYRQTGPLHATTFQIAACHPFWRSKFVGKPLTASPPPFAIPLREPTLCSRCLLSVKIGRLSMLCPRCHRAHSGTTHSAGSLWAVCDTCLTLRTTQLIAGDTFHHSRKPKRKNRVKKAR